MFVHDHSSPIYTSTIICASLFTQKTVNMQFLELLQVSQMYSNNNCDDLLGH